MDGGFWQFIYTLERLNVRTLTRLHVNTLER